MDKSMTFGMMVAIDHFQKIQNVENVKMPMKINGQGQSRSWSDNQVKVKKCPNYVKAGIK